MKVESGTAPYDITQFLNFNLSNPRAPEVQSAVEGADARIRQQLVLARQKVADLGETLKDLERLLRVTRTSTSRPSRRAIAASVADLGLDNTGTATRLSSLEEVNATPTSFSTFGPDWTGSSAQAGIGGEYDGSSGTGALTFIVSSGGVHGTDDLQIKVYDPDNDEIDKLDIKKSHPIDTQYTLDNGLVFTLGEGELLKNDKFTVDVVDSVPTSFSPTEPNWTGSGALVTMDGVYDGSNGTGTLTFRSDKTGAHGVDDLTIKVYDPSDQEIDKIDVKKEDPIDRQYTLSNGLVLTLGEGDLLEDTTFVLGVYESVGSAVDPDKPFNGTRNDNPNLEYGFNVTAGSFQVNDVTIDVSASDTVNTVLDAITDSEAGVTATFNAATEKVVLTQKTAGSDPTILLENDTSGFVGAVKLAGATLTPGEDADPAKPLAEVAEFSSVQSGTLSVEGVDITIDVNTDSLNDVIDRINASGAGVIASLDGKGQRFSISAASTTKQLEIDSGDTGLFPALEIADGAYRPTKGLAGISEKNARRIADSVESVAEALNALYEDTEFGSRSNSFISQLRSDIESAVSEAFDSDGPRFRTRFGVHMNFGPFADGVFEFSLSDQRSLASSLRKGVAEVNDLFLGRRSSTSDGLIEKVSAVLTQADAGIQSSLGFRGLLVDEVV